MLFFFNCCTELCLNHLKNENAEISLGFLTVPFTTFQLKSTTDVTQDSLTDCLTIHPLQPSSFSPPSKVDSALNSSPAATFDSFSGAVGLSAGFFCVRHIGVKFRSTKNPYSRRLLQSDCRT